jgi:hypothetical protein
MSTKLQKIIFESVVVLIVVLLFTIMDHYIHGLQDKWGVPDYYFKDKIPFGFLWGLVGLLLAIKFSNIWLKSLIFAGTIAVTLQFRYFIEGYPLDFVLIFLSLHFIMVYLLAVGMFTTFKKVL